jgi:DNA-binding MarR family transcriptional regulator
MAFPRDVCREIAKECTLFAVRSVSRAVTRLYEEALAPAGLKATQLSILVAAAARDGWTMSDLAEALHMDRTTLTRNAGPLRRKGLIRVGGGRDRRSSVVAITDRGHEVLARAYPLWRGTQRRIIARLGRARWKSLIGALADLKAAARG